MANRNSKPNPPEFTQIHNRCFDFFFVAKLLEKPEQCKTKSGLMDEMMKLKMAPSETLKTKTRKKQKNIARANNKV